MFVVYCIQQNNGKSYWKPCGVAFKNQDNSVNVKLDLLPNVQLQIRQKKTDAPEG